MVYVDDMKAFFRGMIMSHMFADTDAELMEFAGSLGLRKVWKHRDHFVFDVSQSMRARAIKAGAKPITQLEMCTMVMKRRNNK